MSGNKKQPNDQEFLVDNRESILEKDNEINERINRLFGESNTIQKKELKDYDPNELQNIRKKLLFLLVGVIIAGIVIIVLLFNPLDFNFGKPTTTNPSQEENNTNIPNEPEYPIDLDIYTEEVVLLNQRINFSVDELKEINVFPLYMNKTIVSKDIPNNIKLLMLTKDENFYNMLMENGINEYIKSCDSKGVIIDKATFDKVVNSVYNSEISVNYEPINYELFTNDANSKKITLTFNNDKYVAKCNDYSINNDVTKLLQQKLIKAVETEREIELYQKVVFISYEGNIGVYKEPTFKTLITNDKSAEYDDYIEKGSTYKYTFEKSQNNYYLSKVELVEEDN